MDPSSEIRDEVLRLYESMGTRRITPGVLEAFAEGTVGWAADRRVMQLSNGREIIVWETMVFQQGAGEWRLVQFHASLAIPNAEALGA